MTDIADIAVKLAGRFVVIDGPDGAGKGTQIGKLLSLLAEHGVPHISVHDPGDTSAGNLIRQILLSPNGVALDKRCETLLFMASRAQLVAEKIRPALEAGTAVICDRFISATCAYQGAAGMDIDQIIQLGHLTVGTTWPDATLVLDLPADEGLRRIGVTDGGRPKKSSAKARDSVWQGMLFRDAVADSMESKSKTFHERVCEIFRSLPQRYPKPVYPVDAVGSVDEVHQRILEVLGRVAL